MGTTCFKNMLNLLTDSSTYSVHTYNGANMDGKKAPTIAATLAIHPPNHASAATQSTNLGMKAIACNQHIKVKIGV